MKRILPIAMLICFAFSTTAFAQIQQNTKPERINTGAEQVTVLQKRTLPRSSDQSSVQKQQTTKATRSVTPKVEKKDSRSRKMGKNRNHKEPEYTRASVRSVQAEENLRALKDTVDEAQRAYVELQQTHMRERQELEQKHADERLAGVTDELTARQKKEMEELESKQAFENKAAKRALEQAEKKYKQGIEVFKRAQSEKLANE